MTRFGKLQNITFPVLFIFSVLFFVSFRRLYFVNRNIFLTANFTGQSIFCCWLYVFSRFFPNMIRLHLVNFFCEIFFFLVQIEIFPLMTNKTLVSQEINMVILYTESVKGQQHTPILILEPPSHLTMHLSKILKSSYYLQETNTSINK